MLKVLISRNYSYPDLKRQSPNYSGIWNDIELTEDASQEVDFLIVFNQPAEDLKIMIYEGGSWLFLQEPPYVRNEYFKYHFRFADLIISGFDGESDKNIQTQAALPWHLDKSYDELMELKAEDNIKSDRVSWITSNNNMFPGHQPRIDFINYLKEEEYDFDLFGRGFNPIDDKFNGISPYKYSIAVENYSAPDYWTEKAIDCILAWTIPLYYGCTNMGDYFPEGSFVNIDIRNKEKALQEIKNIVEEDFWAKNIDALAKARQLILNEYQMYPMIEKRVKAFFKANPNAKKKQYIIPKSGLTKMEEFKKKTRAIFKK